MATDNIGSVSVIDFRRQSMVLQWHVLEGTWTAHDAPPSVVHGIALIRAAQPNICLYAHDGRLRLQVGPDQFLLSENSPRIKCTPGLVSFGLRRRFSVESGEGVLFSHAYWINRGEDFFRWLAAKAQSSAWRAASAQQWSAGVPAPELRQA